MITIIAFLLNILYFAEKIGYEYSSRKIGLVRMILDTDNPRILASIKRLFTTSKKVDFLDSLSKSQKEEILKGIGEVENGETVDYEEFIKKHR